MILFSTTSYNITLHWTGSMENQYYPSLKEYCLGFRSPSIDTIPFLSAHNKNMRSKMVQLKERIAEGTILPSEEAQTGR